MNIHDAIEFVDEAELQTWLNPVIAKIYQERTIKEKTQKKTGMLGGLFSYFSSAKAEEVPIINEDDTKELTKMIENMKNVTISEEMLSFEYNLVFWVSFPQVFPNFPQWKRWMDKSGKKWWIVGIEERIK